MTSHASITHLLSSTKVQTLLYDAAVDGFRSEETVLDWFAAITQVASREESTVRSPKGNADDRADNNALAAGRCQLDSPWPFLRRKTCPPSGQRPGRDGGKGHTWLKEGTGQGC